MKKSSKSYFDYIQFEMGAYSFIIMLLQATPHIIIRENLYETWHTIYVWTDKGQMLLQVDKSPASKPPLELLVGSDFNKVDS